MSDEDLTALRRDGWSAKEVLLHLTRWHDHATEGIRAILDGREPFSRVDSHDDWNRRWRAADRGASAAKARRRAAESRAALLRLLEERRPDPQDQVIVGWLASNTVGQYPDHAEHLSAPRPR